MASRMISTAIRPAASFAVSRQTVTAQRYFSGSTMALKHKESTGENSDPEKHKQDLLSKHKSGKGHWKPELASDSEEAIKADRGQHEDIASLQNRTKATAEETSKTGTSMRDGL
ncbi:hypothetical protein EV127DRAFT_38072 [Xylaria flabelliformis]|nr:hypothetical protein EV127DRAFT_38072 [Xylaria flabelliformis]KAI0857745.1 hypothetical protein F4860DRAFT_335989 [Xylaria cubensis]